MKHSSQKKKKKGETQMLDVVAVSKKKVKFLFLMKILLKKRYLWNL